MSSFSRSPFFDLRDWWMSDSNIRSFFRVDQTGMVPFYPIQQPPESARPYVIYKYRTISPASEWWYRREFIFMQISGNNFQQIYEVINRMIDYANQGAISARDLSIWLKNNNRRQDFELHSIHLDRVGDSDPAFEEGGDIKIDVSFYIDYSPLQGRNIKSYD